VTDKDPEIRKINTARGESQVFSFLLTDSDGRDVKVAAWGTEADRFFNVLQQGAVSQFCLSSVIIICHSLTGLVWDLCRNQFDYFCPPLKQIES